MTTNEMLTRNSEYGKQNRNVVGLNVGAQLGQLNPIVHVKIEAIRVGFAWMISHFESIFSKLHFTRDSSNDSLKHFAFTDVFQVSPE